MSDKQTVPWCHNQQEIRTDKQMYMRELSCMTSGYLSCFIYWCYEGETRRGGGIVVAFIEISLSQ